jgi:hypothetical protein
MGPVEQAVWDDLPIEARTSALGVAALVIAKTMDSDASSRDLPALSRELRAVLTELKKIYTVKQEDGVDELLARREARRTVG